MFNGEVPEWSKGNAWKAFVRVKLYRRFESCPLRQLFGKHKVMKTIKVPKLFHKFLGEKTTFLELIIIISFAILATLSVCLSNFNFLEQLSGFQTVLIVLLLIDICGGIVSNLSFHTNKYYKERDTLRYIFLAIHIQPLILSLILGEFWLSALLVWLYTITTSLIINSLIKHFSQRIMAGTFLTLGIAGTIILFVNLPPFVLIFLIFYMIKLIYCFSVDHFSNNN